MIALKTPLTIVTLIIKCIKRHLALAIYFLFFIQVIATFAILVMPAPLCMKIFRRNRTFSSDILSDVSRSIHSIQLILLEYRDSLRD